MKATRKFDMLKAIAFMVVVIFFSACNPVEELLKPIVTIGSAENVSYTSATLVANIVPNGEATVTFMYQTANAAWITKTLTSKVTGDKSVKVTLDVTDLQSSAICNYKVSASNSVGSTPSSVSSFSTIAIPSATVTIGTAQNVTINSATLTGTVLPSGKTTVSFEYQTANSAWVTKVLPTKFNTKDLLKVTLDLSDLQANMVYNFRLKASNNGGESVSAIAAFETYAVAIDGDYYHTVTIGTQTWLRENLKVTHYRNGDAINKVTADSRWNSLTTGAYCNYNNSDSIANIYGLLYNWFAIADTRNIAPKGWHVPDSHEWDVLYNYIGTPGYLYGQNMMSKDGWSNPVKTPTNSTGFSALPNGCFNPDLASSAPFYALVF